jgi:ACS family tartrate transporter-like MFS transporter
LAPFTFYWSYLIFEVPSNLIMKKVNARLWIARIMITWGLLAGATALVRGSTSFAAVRLLRGVVGAWFFPAIALHFTYCFPRRRHARIVPGSLIGLPIAVAVPAIEIEAVPVPGVRGQRARKEDGTRDPRAGDGDDIGPSV